MAILIIWLCAARLQAQTERADEITIQLTRDFSKEIFDLNGIPFSQPMVEATNSTSNARFYNRAYIPRSVEKPYFRISLNMMSGFVSDKMKTYSPALPAEQYSLQEALKYADYNIGTGQISIKDTAGLVLYLFKNIVYDGLQDGTIEVPEESASILGKTDQNIVLGDSEILALAEKHPLWPLLPEEYREELAGVLTGIPDFFSLPAGGDIDLIVAGIPQLEIGSLYGTELLLRYIPPVNLGENIGDFSFWGLGARHSISQYFGENPPIDLAIQFVYQGTTLTNKVGVTSSDMQSEATFYDVNIHASKSVKNWFDVYLGLAYETVDISTDFTYVLPREMQIQLGLWQVGQTKPTEEYPGDTKPQKSNITSDDSNLKLTLGLFKEYRDFGLYADFSIRDFGFSNFNIFTFGLQYSFNNPEKPEWQQ